MPLGAVEPFLANIKTQNKSNAAQLALGKVLIRDTSLTPDGWKVSDSAGPDGPFAVAVNDLADTTTVEFSAAFAPSEAIIEAGGALEPGTYVKATATGTVIAHVTGTDTEVKIVGRYLGKEGEIAPTAAISTDKIRVKLGML